jgi:hypothetical protein
VHLFTVDKDALAKALATCRKTLAPTAIVWVSWPKKSAGVPTEVGEDTIRELALPPGFVDVTVCAVTEIWSGLKLVVRKQLRSFSAACRRIPTSRHQRPRPRRWPTAAR